MRVKRKDGYSKAIAREYISADDRIYNVSSQLTEEIKWDNGKPTKEIIAYQAWFVIPDIDPEPFRVEFSEPIKLPHLFAEVKLADLEAREIGNQVYFKAKNVEVVQVFSKLKLVSKVIKVMYLLMRHTLNM